MSTISARGWGWRHAGRRSWAVRGLDLEVGSGETVLLLGPSGAGKSTLLAAVAGLLDGGPHGTGESEGELLVNGVPARRAREDAVGAGSGAARTGLLLQDPAAQTVLARCGDDVAFGLENHGVPAGQIWGRVDGALDAVGLHGGRLHPTARLSGGQRQRLALAGVLALRPGILLLDEPTAMLDPAGTTSLRDLVAGVVRSTGATAVVVEHRVGTWLGVVDRVVVLEPGGGAMADGPAREVLAEHGAWLAEQGVWVPGATAAMPSRADRWAGGNGSPPVGVSAPLLAADAVTVDRPEGPGRPGRPGPLAPVVGDVHLAVHAGRALALTGPNGSGKSTLALALGGLTRPVTGRVRAGPELRAGLPGGWTAAGWAARGRSRSAWVAVGDDPACWAPRQLVGRIGSVFQDPQTQFVAATVAEELAVGPLRLGVDGAQASARAGDLLARMRLDHLARANPFTLSGGEQRRLSVATALAARPRVLVLDEPTFGQDLRTWGELVGLLGSLLDEGTGLVVATHDEALVRVLADTELSLSGGAARPARIA